MNCYVECLKNWQDEFKKCGREIISSSGRYQIEDDRYVPVLFFNRTYKVDLKTGLLLNNDGTPCQLQPMTQMLIYSHMKYVKRDAMPGKEFCSMDNVKGLGLFGSKRVMTTSPSSDALIMKLDHEPSAVDDIIKRFNAKREKYGDISFWLYALPNVRYKYIYWKGDDEFPSNLNIYLGENILSFLDPEGAMMIGEIGVQLMCQTVNAKYEKWSWEI